MSWCVYILRCGDGSLYTGVTNDLPKRLAQHRVGKGAAYTRGRKPLRVVYTEPAEDRGPALSREAAIKRLTRSEKLALVRAARSALKAPGTSDRGTPRTARARSSPRNARR